MKRRRCFFFLWKKKEKEKDRYNGEEMTNKIERKNEVRNIKSEKNKEVLNTVM
jgi:hypothetical protein